MARPKGLYFAVFEKETAPRVTGWSTAKDPPRTYNAEGLRINRIYEQGEVLAFVRLFTSRLATSHEHPSIWEYRYNFNPELNLIHNHRMRRLACGLYDRAHGGGTPTLPQQPQQARMSPDQLSRP